MKCYITIDPQGVIQMWNNEPEFNSFANIWVAWIKKGYINEIGIDISNNDYIRSKITFENSPLELKIKI